MSFEHHCNLLIANTRTHTFNIPFVSKYTKFLKILVKWEHEVVWVSICARDCQADERDGEISEVMHHGGCFCFEFWDFLFVFVFVLSLFLLLCITYFMRTEKRSKIDTGRWSTCNSCRNQILLEPSSLTVLVSRGISNRRNIYASHTTDGLYRHIYVVYTNTSIQ